MPHPTTTPTASQFTQPFSQDAKCGQTDRPWCIAVHYGALRCIAETLQKPCRPLELFQTIAVH